MDEDSTRLLVDASQPAANEMRNLAEAEKIPLHFHHRAWRHRKKMLNSISHRQVMSRWQAMSERWIPPPPSTITPGLFVYSHSGLLHVAFLWWASFVAVSMIDWKLFSPPSMGGIGTSFPAWFGTESFPHCHISHSSRSRTTRTNRSIN